MKRARSGELALASSIAGPATRVRARAPSTADAAATAAGRAGTATRALAGTFSPARNPLGRGTPRPGCRTRPSRASRPAPAPPTSSWKGPRSTVGDSAAEASTPAITASTALPIRRAPRAASPTRAWEAAAARAVAAPAAATRPRTRSLLLVVADDDAAARADELARAAFHDRPHVADETPEALGFDQSRVGLDHGVHVAPGANGLDDPLEGNRAKCSRLTQRPQPQIRHR